MRHWNPKLRAWMPGPPRWVYVLVVSCCVVFMAAATQIDVTTQIKGIVAIANGGTNTNSTLTGLVRGGASFTAAELSGDATTSGSNVVTVPKVNGTSVPTNAAADQALITTASQTGAWVTLPAGCAGAINYVSASHTFTCVAVLTGTFAPAEVPTGLINSANTTYTLAHTPSPAGSLELYKNGQQLIAGGADYTLATATITMVTAPKTGDVLIAYYRW
jgi:hypothetical protein